MSHYQMKNGFKYQIFVPRKLCFWHLLVTCIEFALSSYGKFIGNFLSNKQDYEVPVKCAQRREAKQQFSKNSKWKFLIPRKIEEHLIPYDFNSKGDNLRQAAFLTEFEAVC